jgi:hypothetical protein
VLCDAVVTERWPRDDAAAAVPFPAKLEWFCFPGGWRPVRTRSQPPRPPLPDAARSRSPSPPPPPPRAATFCLQLGGAKAWGVCAVAFEQPPHAHWVARHARPPAHSGRSDEEAWWPVCVCLLTRLPVVSALKAWLREFLAALPLHHHCHQRRSSHAQQVAAMGSTAGAGAQLRRAAPQILPPPPWPPPWPSLAAWLAPRWVELALQLPHAIDGRLAVTADPFASGRRLQYGGGHVGHGGGGQHGHGSPATRPLRPPPLPALPYDAADCRAALASVGSPLRVLEAVACLLGERKVLLHAHSLSSLPPLADLLVSLLYPLQWPHGFKIKTLQPESHQDQGQIHLCTVCSRWPNHYFC